MNHKPIRRVAILWEHLTDYVKAALAALPAMNPQVELLAVQRIHQTNVPKNQAASTPYPVIDLSPGYAASPEWPNTLRQFQPDLAIITGANFRPYREAVQQLHTRGTITVWASDRILRSRSRDIYQALMGRYGRRWRHYDVALVPGMAAAQYAQMIGFRPEQIFQGLYTCDTALYRAVGRQRHQEVTDPWPKAFLFIGQFIERKGIDTLLTAYRLYRQHTPDPWQLWLVGAGPLHSQLTAEPGVQLHGYLPPAETAVLMAAAGCFVLPSRWDHWGVVIHEAACAGLPIIASAACGAAYDLIQPEVNGFIFPPEDADTLANLLTKVSHERDGRLLGQHSFFLSHRFDPQLFAQTVLHAIPEYLQHTRL